MLLWLLRRNPGMSGRFVRIGLDLGGGILRGACEPGFFKFKEGNIPCRGVPHTGHFSAFKVISAPQQAQYAAIGPSKRSCRV